MSKPGVCICIERGLEKRGKKKNDEKNGIIKEKIKNKCSKKKKLILKRKRKKKKRKRRKEKKKKRTKIINEKNLNLKQLIFFIFKNTKVGNEFVCVEASRQSGGIRLKQKTENIEAMT
ncbi:hypothetical protein RFI_29442 [Reticulomyxa filosa]|uniref:Uncharacterized protein n=1 Tax=Reticulomyxa filosa TaxID=46433 RepID=X6M1D3_RETFI|nr:hypothetical protein RFI_29442 [Reticulomyxa filosa]|eukprot:ETO07948.1 hypothetical protein RFI_29442 [Reticulomyxa filosa]